MPKTRFQKVVFAFFTVALSVSVFVVYNLSLAARGLTNQVFASVGPELLYEFPLALLAQLFIAGPLSMKLAFRVVHPSVDQPRLIVLTITFMTIAIMCPLMSLASTFLYHGLSEEFVAQWLQAMFLNFPVAVFSQFFFIGPLVRFVFRKLFGVTSFPSGLSAVQR